MEIECFGKTVYTVFFFSLKLYLTIRKPLERNDIEYIYNNIVHQKTLIPTFNICFLTTQYPFRIL